jgi:hypothetical protein
MTPLTTEPSHPFTGPRWILEDGKLSSGKSGRIDATPEECAAIAKALDLIDCRSLALTYNLKPMQPAGFRMRAEVTATVVQACVVTTEPVASTARDEVDLDLLPATPGRTTEEDVAFDPLSESVTETYADGKIDLGQYAFELLSTAIDPYPRKPGAEFADPGAADKAKLSPFAVLGKLKR